MRNLKPHALLDFLKKEYELKSDGQLCKALGVSAPSISKIRARTNVVSSDLIILIYKKTGMSIEDIEALIEKDSHAAEGTPV
jgi:hypothetical protein